MVFVCSKDKINQALNVVNRVALKTSETKDIMKIKTENENITIIKSDNIISVSSFLISSIEKNGEINISSKIFHDVIKKLPSKEIRITSDDNVLTIKSGNSQFNLPLYSNISFENNFQDLKNFLTLSKNQFKQMIDGVIFCLPKNEDRVILTGSLFKIENNTIKMVAIDGFRIAIINQKLNEESKFIKLIIPIKTLIELSKIMKINEEDINIYYDELYIEFSFDNFKLRSQLVDGEYVDYEKIIPKEFKNKVKINSKDLLNALERNSLLISTLEEPIHFIFSENNLKFFYEGRDGSSFENIEIVYSGEEVEFGINVRFAKEVLKACKNQEILLKFNKNTGPIVIVPTNKEENESDFFYLILPVRIK